MLVRSAYLKPPWQCEIRDVEIDDIPAPGEVLVRVEACGICGSDLWAAQAASGDERPFGHEIAGVVERLGEGCQFLQTGQRVALESSSYCGHCEQCRNGRADVCRRGPNLWGRPTLGFSEYMIVAEQSCVTYEGLTAEVACLAEPAGVALDMVKTAGVQMGDRVCVVGPGPIGLMAIPLALRGGAIRVACIGRSRNRRRLEIASQWGAETRAVDGSLAKCPEWHGQFDHVLSTAPVSYLTDALPLLAYGGTLTYIGFGAGSGEVTLDANDFHRRKLQLRASYGSPGIYLPHVLEYLKTGVIAGETLVSHVMPLAAMPEALTLCREDKGSVVKVVIKP